MRRWLPSLPGAYWVLWSGILINRAGGFAVLFLSLYLTGPRHLPVPTAGVVVGGYGIGSAAGTLLGGVLADRWGRRRTLLLAHFAGAAVLYLLALLRPVPLIAAVVVLVGVFQGLPQPAFVAAIIDVVPGADRSRAFNLQFWAFNIGMVTASLLAGTLIDHFSFAVLFGLDATSTLVSGVLIVSLLPVETGVRPHATADPADRRGIRTALLDRVFLVFVGLTLIQAVITTQGSTILPLSMRAAGLPASRYGLLIAACGVLIVLGQLFVPALIAGRGKGPVLALALTFIAIGYGSVTFATGFGYYLAAAAVWTVGQMLAAPPNATVIAELAPPRIRARYQAVFFLTYSVASFLAPALGGVSYRYLGSDHWLVVAGLGLAAALGHLLASRPRERRVAATRPEARAPVGRPSTMD